MSVSSCVQAKSMNYTSLFIVINHISTGKFPRKTSFFSFLFRLSWILYLSWIFASRYINNSYEINWRNYAKNESLYQLFVYLVFTRMPSESYRRGFRSVVMFV